MKIGIFSDLHLEFRNTKTCMTILKKVEEAAHDFDLMINAGDTHPDPKSRVYVKQKFEPGKYIEVLGNHDFYGSNWPGEDQSEIHQKNGLTILVAPLWTNFDGSNPVVAYYAERQIYDFRKIEGVTANKMLDSFNRTVDRIQEVKPDIVVTHFAPHPRSTHPRFVGQVLNPYFVNNLDLLIEEVKPKLWIHGHVHDPFDYTVHQTRVICNPLGYPGETYSTMDEYHIATAEIS